MTQMSDGSDNVLRLVKSVDTVSDVVAEAAESGLTSVLVLGYTEDGRLFVRSSSNVTRKDALWMVENVRQDILNWRNE